MREVNAWEGEVIIQWAGGPSANPKGTSESQSHFASIANGSLDSPARQWLKPYLSDSEEFGLFVSLLFCAGFWVLTR